MRFRPVVWTLLLIALSPLFGADEASKEGCTSCGMTIAVVRTVRTGNTVDCIEMENTFQAANLTIIVGDTVKWTNNGQEDHTATSDQGLWDSGRMKPGAVYSHTFKTVGEFPYNCVYHKTKGMRGRIIVLPPPPVITSSLTPTAGAGLPFYYAISASNNPTAFTADGLPAGLVFSGSTITGTAPAPGTYPIALGATSDSGTDSKTLTLNVISAIPESDQDGDGYADALETLATSDPSDSNSTPFGIPASATAHIQSAKISIALHFDKPGKDAFKFSGIIPVGGPVQPLGMVAALDFGGIVKQFTLDKSAAAKVGGDSFKITLKSGLVLQAAKFSINLSKGNFVSTLGTIGLNGSADVKNEPKALSLTILFNGMRYQTTQIVSYSAKMNKSATAK